MPNIIFNTLLYFTGITTYIYIYTIYIYYIYIQNSHQDHGNSFCSSVGRVLARDSGSRVHFQLEALELHFSQLVAVGP